MATIKLNWSTATHQNRTFIVVVVKKKRTYYLYNAGNENQKYFNILQTLPTLYVWVQFYQYNHKNCRLISSVFSMDTIKLNAKLYATQTAKMKSILIFFKLFSVYTCEYSFANTITKRADWSVQFYRGHTT